MACSKASFENTPVLKAVNRSLPGFEHDSEGEWNGPFHFVQAADTQLGLIDRYILKLPVSNWEKEIALTKLAIEKANAMQPKPRFFIICGDLVDAYPGQNELRMAQTKDFMAVFQQLDPAIPLVCVCGNHDLGDQPTPESLERYKNVFGDDYFSFWVGGVFFLVLNSQFYENPCDVQIAAEEQDKWLDVQLMSITENKAKYVIIFQHIPWFLKDVDEDKEYSNLPLGLRKTYLEKFQTAGVKTVFCGHYHRNAGGYYKDVEVVVTSAIGGQLGTDQSGFRVVKILDHLITHEYYALEDVPSEIVLNDLA